MEHLKRKKSIVEKFFIHLFFLFFTMQILSPSINSRTLYLELIVALMNPFFINWLKHKKVYYKILLCIVGIVFISSLGHFFTAVKLLMIFIGVLYLYYSEQQNCFYLKEYVCISILIAILQFLFMFIDMELAIKLGPQNIAKIFWGEYATAANTNFYAIFLIARVSGLSREAGFFASLIVAVMFFYYLKRKYNGFQISNLEKYLLGIGYCLSFSKMSLALLIILAFEKIKEKLNSLPFVFTVLFFPLLMILFWNYNVEYLLDDDNITFLHRFGAYLCLDELNFKNFIFGIYDIGKIGGNIANLVAFYYEDFAGFGGFVINNGILVSMVYFFILFINGITSTGILILFFLTINVQFDTNQNFVVLSYFIVMRFFREERKINFLKRSL